MVKGLIVVALAWAIPGPVLAQETRSVAGMALVGYYLGKDCCGPYVGSAAIGVHIGLERDLSSAISLRATGTLTRGFFMADDISICYGNPDVGCIPNPIYPRTLVSAEMHSLIRLYPRAPLRALVGFGLSRASDAREAERGARPTGQLAIVTVLARTGLELSLGRSPRAPRVQWTRTHFWKDLYQLSKAEAIALLLIP